MKIIVKPHDIQISETDTINEGEYNITQLNFEFSAEYTDDLVKKAIFIGNDNKAYEMVIDNNICNIPSEILVKQQSVFLGVYAYKITGSELVLRYSPSPVIFPVIDGSYKADAVPSEEITPSQFEQYQQALQKGLSEVNTKLQEVIDTSETLEDNGTYAKEQGDYAKETTDELVSKVENGDFNGATFTPSVDAEGNISWSNDKGLDNPQTQNIKGEKGDTGEPFTISKTYPSVEEMNADFDNMNVGDYVMIASSVEDEDNAKLYVKTDTEWTFITDFSGAVGIKGEKGDIGPQGPQGVPGKDGVGITTITSGQSTVEEDKTITPITVNKTDGSSQIFNVEAKNGADGKDGLNGKDGVNGQDGLTPTIGDNGNWYLGDTDTGKPSRGEVGPSPDLSDYVKNTDYAKDGQGGVISTGNHFRVYSNNGVPYVNSINSEQYSSSGDNIFIGKGTLESIKDDYVGSSTPVQDLTSTVTNIQEEQDENKPKNTASGEMITVDDAIKYKLFNFMVDGASEQITTTGKNLFDYTTVRSASGLTTTINTDGSITTKGTPTVDYIKLVLEKDYNDKLVDGETYTISQDVAGYIYLQIYAVPKDGGSTIYYASSNSQTRKEFSFTVDKSIYDYKATLQSGLLADVGENINFTAKFQLEKGSKATSYEPYTGGQPSPSPDYPQEITTLTFDKITRCGKNLFDYDKFLNDIGDSLTIEGTNNNFTYRSNNSIPSVLGMFKFNFKEKKSYSFSGKISSSSANGAMKVIYTDGTSLYIYSKWDGTSLSKEFFKTTDGTKTIKQIELSSYGNGTVFELTDFMISEGSQATDYEPYQATEYTIDLQGNEMVELPNGVINKFMIDKKGNVSLIKNIGKVILDGSENNWDWNMITEDEKYRFSTGVIQSLVEPSTPCLSNYFMSGSADDGDYFVENTIEIAPSGGITICTYAVSKSIEEFRAWLQEHNVIVYYQLATPEIIPLGKLTELITTEEGINTFFINGNLETTLEVLYALDIKKYIDNKLAEISSALIKEG